jgi:hypothetical protein
MPSYRQLGSGGQQPVRVQMIISLVVGLVLVAVPLYLWRRPQQVESGAAGATSASASGPVTYVPPAAVSALKPKVKLSPFKTIRCVDPGPSKTPPERCDHVTYFEDALSRSIQENVICAPSTKAGANISFVMDLDFRRKKLKIYRGKSSSLSRGRTKELFRCVKRGMPTPEWGSIPHQHARYVVSAKASYPPSETF